MLLDVASQSISSHNMDGGSKCERRMLSTRRRAECRQEKRDEKQEGREGAREIKKDDSGS